MSNLVRRLVAAALLGGYMAVAPSHVPLWRAEPDPGPGIVLVLGDASLGFLPLR